MQHKNIHIKIIVKMKDFKIIEILAKLKKKYHIPKNYKEPYIQKYTFNKNAKDIYGRFFVVVILS